MNHWILKVIIVLVIIIIGKIFINHQREEFAKTQHGKSIYSPDKKNKAVFFMSTGGGGISPYCVNVISVVPANTPDYIAWDSENNVYVADCHPIGVQHTKDSEYNVYDPIINWKSNEELGVTFVQARVWKTLSSDGKIRIVQEKYHEQNITNN